VVTENKHQPATTAIIIPRLLFKTSSHTKYLSVVGWPSAEPLNMDMMGEIYGTVSDKWSASWACGKVKQHSAVFL